MPDTATPDRSQLEGAQKLLDAALEYVGKHGYQDLSLRAVAQLLGTSHRMLIYYFGSSEGFWIALAMRLRQIQVQGLLNLFSAQGIPPTFEQAWAYLSSEEQLPYFRLLFQVYGRVLSDPEQHQRMLYTLTDEWLMEVSTQLATQLGMSPDEGRTQARLRMAVIRGLMLDLLCTNDQAGVSKAIAMFSKALPLP